MIRIIIAQPHTGVAHCIASPDEAPYGEKFRSLASVNVPVRIPHRQFRISALKRLATFARQARVTVIHSHGFGAGIYGRIVSVLTGIPCIHTFHGLGADFTKGWFGGVKWAIEWSLAGFTEVLVAVSNSEASQAERMLKRRRNRIQLIENGIELPLSGTSSPRTHEDGLVVGWVGRLCDVKNPLAVLDIAEGFTKLSKHSRPPRFLVVGDGPLFKRMSDLIERRGLHEVVELTGSSNRVLEILAKCHVFLSTSWSEGLPVAMLEAMSCGLPVVATRVQGNRDLVHDHLNGYLFPTSDPLAASDMLVRLAEDEELRRRFGSESRRLVVARFSAERMRSAYTSLYTEVAYAHPKEPR